MIRTFWRQLWQFLPVLVDLSPLRNRLSGRQPLQVCRIGDIAYRDWQPAWQLCCRWPDWSDFPILSVPDGEVKSGLVIYDWLLELCYLSKNILRTDLHWFTRRSTAKYHDGCPSLGPAYGLLQGWREAGALDDDVEAKLLTVHSSHGRGQTGGIRDLEASVWAVK